MVVKHTAHGSKGVFTAMKDGKKAGEMTYSMAGTDKMIVDHTEVDEAFKGMGVGKQLLVEGVVAYARENKIKVLPLCPFASAAFKKMSAEIGDVLA
ncbi:MULTISPECIES: GNAT family N-acetyltransferase [Myroides]|uniref:GNAT family N-acetyltransferase n=1 Tax=Myroides TaxID=76831 RepID=UPI0013032F54|nr:GNAT family N-acetyltransferase [Myroides phaeus]